MSVLILTGPPGAGKTTVARLLATKAERAVHLETDWFFDVIKAGFVEPWKPESHTQNEAVMKVVATAAAGYADAGYFTILDGIFLPAGSCPPFATRCKRLGTTSRTGSCERPWRSACNGRAGGRDAHWTTPRSSNSSGINSPTWARSKVTHSTPRT